MKILYIDINNDPFFEDYSLKPKKYGGGRVFASYMKEHDCFYIISDKKSYENFSSADSLKNCLSWTEEDRKNAIAGKPLKDIIPNLNEFNIIITHNPSVYFNLEGAKKSLKQCAWCVGYLDRIHKQHKHILLYNDYQSPLFDSKQKINFYKIVIGKELPEFKVRNKKGYIFVCSRQCGLFNSIPVASWCKDNYIEAYFAGPIEKDYRFMDCIDNHHTFYLGEISEEEKYRRLEEARLCPLIHNWPTPFSLSAVESLSVGTPIACANTGFWPSLIKGGKNGFFIDNYNTLMQAYKNAEFIDQADCYNSTLPYSKNNMIQSVYNALKSIYEEK